LLGPAGKGAYAVLTLIPSLVAQLASMGIYNANIYLIGRKETDLKTAAENALTISIFVGGVLLGVYWLARTWIDPLLFKGIAPEITFWVSLTLPLHFSFLMFNYLALADNDLSSFNVVNVGRSVYILLGLAVVALLGAVDLWKVNLIWVITNAMLAAQSWWLIYRRRSFGLRWHPALFRSSIKFALQSHLGTVFYLMGWRLDFLLCNIYLDARAVGYYSIAVLIGEVLWFIPQTLTVVLLPHLSRLSDAESGRLTLQVCRLTFASSTVGAVVLLAGASLLVGNILGEAFLPAVTPLWLLLPGMVFESGTRILSSFFVARGMPMTSTRAAGLVFLSNLLMNLWSIPRYGIIGAAVSSTISYSAGFIYAAWTYGQSGAASYRDILLARRQDFKMIYERSRGFFHE
jgi:O-antigen/teichoic acid export membrane protein